MNNISFQGKSTLIFDPKTYSKTVVETSKSHRHLSATSRTQLISGTFYTTEANSQNVAVIVKNENKGIFKIIPTHSKIDKFLLEIADSVENLKKQTKSKLTAWIIGGESYHKPAGDATIETVNKIADIICDTPDIDTSIIAGSKSGCDRFVIHPLKENIEITLDKQPMKNVSTSCSDEELLENYFDIVELNNTQVK